MTAGTVLRRARRKAGLTQAELAKRLGTTQSVVARLESTRHDPRIGTLDAALRGTGHRLELRLVREQAGVDEAQIVERLRLSPAERLTALQASQHSLGRLLGSAKRVPRRAA